MTLARASNPERRRASWLCVALTFIGSTAAAAPAAVSYTVRVDHPTNQMLEVEMRLRAPLPLELALPAWAPGSYRERHFIRSLRPGEARTASGRRLRWVRSGPDRYRLEATGGAAGAAAQPLTVRYSVLATSFADDASHVDGDHAHLCGATVFVLASGFRGAPHLVRVVVPRNWRVATPLDPLPGRAGVFVAADYDELVDAPFELGHFEQAEVKLGAQRLRIAWHDAERRPMPAQLPGQLRRIAELHRRWLGPPPYPRYLLVIHTAGRQEYRGLEHARGASLVVPTSVLDDREDYDDLLYVIAHEHLHVWNGKWLRPAEHLPYDYVTARPTRLLWWTEGVTDYLARRSLLGIGRWRAAEYLEQLDEEISRVQTSPQRLWLSLSDLSFEAFWPHRDPGTAALTYYTKGHVVALLLDLELRGLTAGRVGLLQVLQRLLGRGRAASPVALTRADLERELRAATGADLGPKLAAWVDQPGELAYAATLGRLGLRLVEKSVPRRPEIGFAAELQGGELVVDGVDRDGPAARAGLALGDRVIAIDGSRPNPGWRVQLADPTRHVLRIHRRGATRELALMVRSSAPKLWLLREAPVSSRVAAQRAAWLAP